MNSDCLSPKASYGYQMGSLLIMTEEAQWWWAMAPWWLSLAPRHEVLNVFEPPKKSVCAAEAIQNSIRDTDQPESCRRGYKDMKQCQLIRLPLIWTFTPTSRAPCAPQLEADSKRGHPMRYWLLAGCVGRLTGCWGVMSCVKKDEFAWSMLLLLLQLFLWATRDNIYRRSWPLHVAEVPP